MQGREFRLPAHKARQTTSGHLQAPPQGTGPDQLEDLHGLRQAFTGTGPSAVTCISPSASRSVSAVNRMLPGVASCSIRAARCVVWPMAE